MGKGDRRSRRGKICRGTHGKTRPKKKRSAPPASTGATRSKTTARTRTKTKSTK